MLIRTGDLVEVTTGNARGTRAKVLAVRPDDGKVVVEGVGRVYRHMKRSQKNPQGGRLSREMPISVSNVLLVCSACSKATRVGVRLGEDGSKSRVCRKCKADIGIVRPPRAAKVAARKK
ncbi:MAG: 50S ribosomal protein L24 [Planctomycetia bacterium]